MKWILKPQDEKSEFVKFGGGKAKNMAGLSQNGFSVPEWFCISSEALDEFVVHNSLQEALIGNGDFAKLAQQVEEAFVAASLPEELKTQIEQQIKTSGLENSFLAVRSSGLDEDSADNSFAGQFSSYLYQKGSEAIFESLKRCWASGYSERALSYRVDRGLGITDIKVGVVIQKMVNCEISGVAFSRHPIHVLEREKLLVSSVYGIGEGLVSGELDADNYVVERKSRKIEKELFAKEERFVQAENGGLKKEAIPVEKQKESSLTDPQVLEVAKLVIELEDKMGSPQDCEWGFENGQLYCVQTRPITNLPPDAFYEESIIGGMPTLWDNSNIIESYSGVTSPLTFSFASRGYRQVYIQFCEVVGVPQKMIEEHEAMYRNMLGIIRGQIYYNLVNWYRLVLMLPGSASNKDFMETMMGVKQHLKPEQAKLFDFVKTPPKYSLLQRIKVLFMTIKRFVLIDRIVKTFMDEFHEVYNDMRGKDFKSMSLNEQLDTYNYLEDEVLRKWQPPIINDYLCMLFFGVLKKLTGKWLSGEKNSESLQNDLLCGQGNLESTEPTKMLMRIARAVDLGDPSIKDWLLKSSLDEATRGLFGGDQHVSELGKGLHEFVDKYGFRCINELKLEETDMYDDPSFAVNSIVSYVRTKSYDIEEMEKRERAIRVEAESKVNNAIGGLRRIIYYWVLKHARKAVGNRENLRFARTKIFGICRHLFRGIGHNLHQLGQIAEPSDVFYLTVEEFIAFIEGRAVTNDLMSLTQIRKSEYDGYRKGIAAPDRLLSHGAVGVACHYPQVLAESDILTPDLPVSTDPNTLMGTPCCPGVIEGEVRVVKDIKDAEGIEGQILVTARTDPGWVPLYPSCSGLLIERGSLLSHSAVVARELGLPTIVGISGGLMTKLKTGQRVRIDAGRGEVKILQ